MTSLAFLSPDLARETRGLRPLLKSSMERRQREAGATFAERDGWLLPIETPGEARHLERVGIADLSHLGKLEVRGNGKRVSDEGVVWYQVTAERALVLCSYTQTAGLRDRLGRRFRLVIDQTAAFAVIALVGPEAPAVLRRLTHLSHFPASGELAHVPAHVLERNGAYCIVFPQEYGHYVWEVAVDAAEPFGGGPVGVAALEGWPE
jgi:glycine cleavage system aminomethyltransferase T